MNLFLPLPRPALRGLVITLIAAAGIYPTRSLAAAELPIVEIRGLFVHATKLQREAALDAALVDRNISALTPAQFEAARAALKKEGAEVFSEPRVICQSGQSADVTVVKEFYYATRYDPSKKESGKSVPIKFGMRYVGVTLEAVPSVDANGRIRLKTTPAFTRFLGFVDYSNLKLNETNPPALEELFKAPLNAGGVWQPFFATFTVTRTFEMDDGATAVMSGPVAVEQHDPPPGQPVLQSHSPAPEVLVFLTAKKVARD